jgi:hypothetical protein
VFDLLVLGAVAGLSEALVAHPADEWFIARVTVKVVFNVARLVELLPAVCVQAVEPSLALPSHFTVNTLHFVPTRVYVE